MTVLIAPIPAPLPVREPVMVTSLRQQLRRGAAPSVLYRIAGGEAAFWRLVSAYALADSLSARGKAALAEMRLAMKPDPSAGDAVPDVPFRRCLAPAVTRASSRRRGGKPKAVFHSTDLGAKPRVVWIALGQLVVDKTYQREIGGAGVTHVNHLLREFNWNCYQPIIVGEREDGRFAVIDGQHRLEAARKHPLIDELPCYVVDAPGVAAQASIFAAVNGRRLALTSQQKFWAAHAGGDAKAIEVARLCAVAGVAILRSPPSTDIAARSILAPFTLQKLVRQVGTEAVGLALELLAETHGETPNAFRSPTVAALCRIATGKGFASQRTKRALRQLDLDRLYDDARRDRVTGGGQAGDGRGTSPAPALRCGGGLMLSVGRA